MILLRCPKFPRCLTADAPNFDRGHSLTSLHLPLAALSSLPTSARSTALLATVRRGRRPRRPAPPHLLLPIRRGRCPHRPAYRAPCNPSVGVDDSVRPLHTLLVTVSLRGRSAPVAIRPRSRFFPHSTMRSAVPARSSAIRSLGSHTTWYPIFPAETATWGRLSAVS